MVKTNRTVDKRQQNIKKKLTSAIVMLLVSCIMVVTSTYAWFTLSTAPEVKGIQTTVGGNGNLEITLAYYDGSDAANVKDSWANVEHVKNMTTDDQADSMLDNNIAWGNLIDLSTGYGLDLVTLYPAKLNESDGKVANTMNGLLLTPLYGADGRVTGLDDNTVSGIFNSTSNTFNLTTAARGVRAIGTSTSMSARQLGYLSAISGLRTKSNNALTAVKNSLNDKDGGALAAIAIKHGTSNGSETYTLTDLDSINGLISGLENAVSSIEQAILEAIHGYAASAELQSETETPGRLTDAQYETFVQLLRGEEFSLASNISVSGSTITVTAGTFTLTFTNQTLATTIEDYQSINTDVSDARRIFDDIDKTDNSVAWSEIADVLNYLISTNGLKVCGMTMGEINMTEWDDNGLAEGGQKETTTNDKGETVYKSGIDKLLEKYMSPEYGSKIHVELGEGSGIYYDISRLVGKFTTSITIPRVSAMGIILNNVPATMTVPEANPSQLAAHLTAVGAAGQPTNNTADADKNLSDYFGYAIDLLFRTNAANSNLLLSEAQQRIYSDSTNESTMGGGSTMTFTSSHEDFTVAQMTELMKAIRIVFIDDQGNVVKKAGLDAANVRQDGASITADIKVLDANGAIVADTVDASTGVKTNTDVITALEQNTVLKLTVLVYLDGDQVENADVAITPTSMTGTMNLQFESDADLVPMNYTELKEGTGTSTPDAGGEDTPNA